jgi:hypothetical protein
MKNDFEPHNRKGSSIMFKGTPVINCRKLHKQILGLRDAGKNEREIADALGLTSATIRYVASICLPDHPTASGNQGDQADHKQKLAYEMWQAGKGFAEINQALQINTVRARQMIHRHAWILRNQ